MPLPEPEKIAINMTLDGGPLGAKKKPPAIQNPFYNACEFDKAGDHKKAEKIYLELLNADFSNCIVMAALGMCYASQERNGIARLLLQTALDNIGDTINSFKRLGVTPKSEDTKDVDAFTNIKRSEIYNALGTCYKHENHVDEARKLFIKAQEGLPLNPDIQNNLGTLYINEGKPIKALEHLDLALTLQPDHPQARWNKSLAHLEDGDYLNGWKHYDAGFDAKVRGERSYSNIPLPQWKGEEGKNVIVYGEQGIGDEIMFASCLSELIARSKSVVFDCHKKLHTLFSESFPTIDIYPTREDEMLVWPNNPDGSSRYNFDARIAIGSLPALLRPNLESFPGTPFIKPNIAKEAEYLLKLSKLSEKPKIGISWIGGHKRTRVEVRSTTLESLLPILQQDATFISLQYTECADEITAFEKKHNIKIHQFNEATQSPNYADAAALVANLDLVITVCTSVVHLAGSMGVPTWVLTPSRPAWRYKLIGDTMPWYNSVTLFRQEEDTTVWEPVIAEIAVSLGDMMGALQ